MPKMHVVKLEPEQRMELELFVRRGRHSVRELKRARILLEVDHDRSTDEEAAEAAGVSVQTVQRTRKRFGAEGLPATVGGHPQPPRPQKRRIDGDAEAKLVTLACSDAPDGRERWTLELLAEQMVQLKYVDGRVSGQTVRRVLKKTRSNRG